MQSSKVLSSVLLDADRENEGVRCSSARKGDDGICCAHGGASAAATCAAAATITAAASSRDNQPENQ